VTSTNCPTYLGTIAVTNGIGYADNPPAGYTPRPTDYAQPGSCLFIRAFPAAGTLFTLR